jgi:two-component sensor histidine kinase
VHELTTNSAKYGAFSAPSGRVVLSWHWRQQGTSEHLVVDWQEIGGPAIVSAPRAGYGTSIIRELIPFELGGAVELAFLADGVHCRLEIPSDWLSPGHPASEESPGNDPPWHGLMARQHLVS